MMVTGVREFRNRTPELIGGKELVFVTRHGHVSSLLVPLKGTGKIPADLRRELIGRIGKVISAQLTRTGISESRLLRDFKIWRTSRRAHRRGR